METGFIKEVRDRNLFKGLGYPAGIPGRTEMGCISRVAYTRLPDYCCIAGARVARYCSSPTVAFSSQAPTVSL